MNDLRHALRALLKAPVFSTVAVLTLALCVGANSAIFSVVHSILLKPYPWPDSDRLVYVYNSYPLMGLVNAGVSIPDYLDRRAGVAGFAESAIYHFSSFNLSEGGRTERLDGLVASPSLFPTLRTAAALGRTLTDDDAAPGAPPVVVLSHAFWAGRFGADASILGRTVRLDGVPRTVVGVMPAGFDFPRSGNQVWVPFTFSPAERSDAERGNEYSIMIARLKPGATPAAVQRDLDGIQRRNAERLPDEAGFWRSSGFGGRVSGFLEQNVAGVRAMLWLVQCGVAAALLIGCANVASLLLARALAREHEFAVRAAIGAGRWRLARLFLTESLLLFLVGGVLGLVVALWGLAALAQLGFLALPRGAGIHLDGAVFAFTLLSAMGAGLVFGGLPAWSVARRDAAAALRVAGTRATAGRQTQLLRGLLVGGEIALAVMLLATAGLLAKSFARLQGQDPGFVAANVLTARYSLTGTAYDDPARRAAFAEQLVARARELPGVTGTAVTSVLPFTGNNSQSTYRIEGRVTPAGQPEPHGQNRMITPGYFPALGIPLLRGRLFTAQDDARGPGVVIIDRVLADRYWPNADPIGHHLLGGDGPGGKPWTIVGVVAAAKFADLEDPVTKETLYFPVAQASPRSGALVLKTAVAPAGLVGAVRGLATAIDSDQTLYDLKTMTTRVNDSLTARRVPMVLIALFSGIALLLSVLGVYGVLAHAVTQRTPEFGIRLALGATGRDIALLVFRQGAALVGAGVAAGLAGYFALSRIVGRLLFGVAPTDPWMLTVAAALLAAAAFAACWLPARRATRVDPIVALRPE